MAPAYRPRRQGRPQKALCSLHVPRHCRLDRRAAQSSVQEGPALVSLRQGRADLILQGGKQSRHPAHAFRHPSLYVMAQ